MSKLKKIIKYSKERAVLSDALPYEIPITFSNRHFYKFLINNKVELEKDRIKHECKYNGDEKEAFEIILEILFEKGNTQNPDFRKIPFIYRISHKENDFRELALIHPINQLRLIQFYDTYKESIIYSCSVSSFSIRRPDDIAKFSYFNDQLHQKVKGDDSDFLELSGKEYESLKTFFSYKKYTNIYRFYEDYRYQRAEKKYKMLFKFDISKCFDSIYSHSIAWAILGIGSVKENILSSNLTFGGRFDDLMKMSNYGETNGILIGPEFSRVFAEIILQSIDQTLENKLKSEGLTFKKEYELYRYVDDYFLFCDGEVFKNRVLEILKHELKKYKLSLNNAKAKDYVKPIITEITIAKEKIIQLFNKYPKFEISKISLGEELEDEAIEFINHQFNIKFDPNRLATKYKVIIKESLVDYKDVLNYSLEVLNKKIERNLKSFEKVFFEYREQEEARQIPKKELNKIRKIEEAFTSHIENFIDFVFFIYSVSPRVNSTIKVSHILSKIIKFFKEKINKNQDDVFKENNRQRVFKKILDESGFVLGKNSLSKYSQIQSLYLLTVLRDLGKQYRLSENLLSKFLDSDLENGEDIKMDTLNYFSIVVLFFYIAHSKKYSTLKLMLKNYTLKYINTFPKEIRHKSSELTHLVLDLLACPFISLRFKKKVLSIYRGDFSITEMKRTIEDSEKIAKFHKSHEYWFTKWERFNLYKELENKKSQEVYS